MPSQALAVFFVLTLLGAALWLARRKGVGGSALRLSARTNDAGRRMRVVERLPLGGQHSLHLVECEGRRIVVAVSPTGCNALAEFSDKLGERFSTRGGGR